MTIGERLALIRKDQGMSMDKFGKIIGLTRAAISNYECDKRALSNQTITALVQNFNVNEKWLMTGDGEMYLPKTESEIIMERIARNTLAKNKGDDYAWFKERLASAILKLDDAGCQAMLDMLADMGYKKG